MHRSALLLLCGVITLGTLIGCQGDDSGLSENQTKMASQVENWAKESGGNWDKLSDEQKQTMISSVGSEDSARKVLEMKANPPKPVNPGMPSR